MSSIKIIAALLLLILLISSLLGCNADKDDASDASATAAAETTAEPAPTAATVSTPAPTHQPAPTVTWTAWTPEPETTPYYEPLEPPVYNLDDFMNYSPWTGVVCDFCCGTYPWDVTFFTDKSPDLAHRQINNNRGYIFFETEDGYRFYILYDRKLWPVDKDKPNCVGFPIYVKELHSYSEFSGLKIGDTIDDVAAIDPIAGRIRDKLLERGYTAEHFHNSIKWGMAFASFHYLSDGVLKIEYDMNDDGVIFIFNMEYSSNYRLVSKCGVDPDYEMAVNYKLLDIDLPQP